MKRSEYVPFKSYTTNTSKTKSKTSLRYCRTNKAVLWLDLNKSPCKSPLSSKVQYGCIFTWVHFIACSISVRLEVSRAKWRAEFSLFPLFDFRIALSLTIRTPQTGYLLRAHSFHITRKQSKEEKKNWTAVSFRLPHKTQQTRCSISQVSIFLGSYGENSRLTVRTDYVYGDLAINWISRINRHRTVAI